jgi:hypothetical protein
MMITHNKEEAEAWVTPTKEEILPTNSRVFKSYKENQYKQDLWKIERLRPTLKYDFVTVEDIKNQ